MHSSGMYQLQQAQLGRKTKIIAFQASAAGRKLLSIKVFKTHITLSCKIQFSSNIIRKNSLLPHSILIKVIFLRC